MDHQYPVFTEKTECQDCYKCLRHCPVKAIRVENGRAAIMPERCIACGTCVGVCPNNAKQVRDDLRKAELVMGTHQRVIATLAPSWTSEFTDIESNVMIAALKQLGFWGVSETALGAQIVSQQLAESFAKTGSKLAISSACPAAADFVRKYIPSLSNCITTKLSPALAHCKLLREMYGEDIGIIFFSPCIAKKNEADEYDDGMDVALTFDDLHRWLENQNIMLSHVDTDGSETYIPEKASDGALYPVEGGMLQTLKMRGAPDAKYITVSGIYDIDKALAGINPDDLKSPVFVEILSCKGGCINGPCMTTERPGLLNILATLEKVELANSFSTTGASLPIAAEFSARDGGLGDQVHNDEEIRTALLKIGKVSAEDELNCGGCGYDCCRSFAKALLEGRAEPGMCVSYLKKLAQKKANALLRCIPAGVVIVDSGMRIIESNEYFAELIGEDAQTLWAARPGLEGASVEKLLPFANMFRENLDTGRDIHKPAVKACGKILDLRIFSIDPGQVVGAVMADVTSPGMRREQIAQKAQMVIKKNLETVQTIAAELGENMAETEILLRSLAEDYAREDESHE